MPKRLWGTGLSWLLAAACSSDHSTPPVLPPCTAASAGQVTLAVAAYTAVDPTQTAGCAVFPANPSAAAIRYLLVPQSASPTPNDSEPYRLQGNPLAAPPAPGGVAAARLPAALRFDLGLRRTERELARGATPLRRATPAAPAGPAAPAAPVDSGNVRTFKVCAVVTCDPRQPSTFANVTATALKVGQHIAIYVDNQAPQPGLTQLDLDALRAVFDSQLYEADTLAFGRESDIDSNGVVIVLMTGKVNTLVTKAQCDTSGFIAGYFFGADLITVPPFSTGNDGEIFYSIVPDSLATLSCAHTVSQVKRLVPVTFVHEFQHMISFNQHFLLRGTAPEDLWLNEGLSHYAEEHGGRRFLPDINAFCPYVVGDLYNAGQYLLKPAQYFLVDTAGIGGLANRGAYWLFVRFLVDQFARDTSQAAADAFTRSLEATSLTGAANVSAATGTAFATLVERWGLANYVSDLAGFAAPPELQYVSWKFRSAFPLFNAKCSPAIPASFPLAPVTVAANAVNVSGVLRAGSGGYYLAQQGAAAAGFTLLFSDAAGTALRVSLVPQLTVLRLQ
jgi:hypothetical protein